MDQLIASIHKLILILILHFAMGTGHFIIQSFG